MGLNEINIRMVKFSAIFIIFIAFLTVVSIAIWNFSTRSSVQAQEPECSPVITKEVVPSFDVLPGDTVDITIAIPGCTAELRNPADTMLVMDRSGSMSINWLGKPKIDSAKDALKAFVDQTQEDGATPGDYVGLASYSSKLYDAAAKHLCVFHAIGGTLDSAIVNMTAANKTALANEIDSLYPCGGTPIGPGMDIANQELLNNARGPEVAKYMVLATDGRQNTAPSPYENNILQTAIDSNITIFTVGIGNDVTTTYVLPRPGCVDCPNPTPSGDNIFSGEELMKDIACRTDQNRLDPADNCILVWNTTNDPAINDWDNPAHYYFADDPAKLEQIYIEIANEISSNVWFQVLDVLNAAVFSNIVTDSVHAVDCATGDPWLGVTVLFVTGNFFMIRLENVGILDTVCIKLQAKVRLDAAPGEGLWVDQIGLAVVWDPDNLCDPAVDGIITCIWQMMPLPRISIPPGSITIVDPAKPWLKTTGGDVGSFFDIDMLRDPWNDNPQVINADYLVIADLGITNFRSDKDWLIRNYTPPGGINISPDPGASMYDALWDKYSGRGYEDLSNPQCRVRSNQIRNAVNASGAPRNFRYDCGDAEMRGFDYKDAGVNIAEPVVVFVKGDLNILRQGGSEKEIADNTGIIFVVDGNLTIEDGVERVDGIFITNGEFNTYRGVSCGNISIAEQLVINGAVYAFGEACFTRDLSDNRTVPAEIINFEPKYLWLFQEIVGDPTVIYREVAP